MSCMNDKALNNLIKALPEGERTRAIQRITQAVQYGWQEISFWDDISKPRLNDLVGLDAGGRFDFLPASSEEEE